MSFEKNSVSTGRELKRMRQGHCFAEGLLEGTSTPLFAIDTDHRVIVWNRAMVELTGVPAREVVGTDRQWASFYPDKRPILCDLVLDGRIEELGRYYSHYELDVVMPGIVRAEATFPQLNGRQRRLCFDASPVKKEGHVIAVVETLYDMTARVEAEELLRLSERQLLKQQSELVLKHEQLSDLFRQVEQAKREWEQTMDCVDDMVAMVDSSGKIRRCNRAFMRFTGCSFPELLQRKWSALLREAGLEVDEKAPPQGELFHRETRRWFTLKRYPYDEGRGTVIMLHDLTRIKEVSDELEAAYQDLKSTHSQLLQQEKMASIGQLAAGVAHEINNPMGFISSNLGTMEKYLERLTGFLAQQSAQLEKIAPPPVLEELARARRSFKVDYVIEDARSLLSESRDGAERVRGIVQNLKSFSRVDEVQASWVDLNECLETTVSIAWNELKYKTVLNRDYGELPPVKCLPQQLNQVFLNLLVNAAHAIETRGEITIRTRGARHGVTVAISDTGCGIPPAIRNRIFEPFFTTKAVGKGTGLGLSISYDIIKKHGGSIEVESAPGEGTTFTVTLPLEGEPA